jgi:hypothetical protein
MSRICVIFFIQLDQLIRAYIHVVAMVIVYYLKGEYAFDTGLTMFQRCSLSRQYPFWAAWPLCSLQVEHIIFYDDPTLTYWIYQMSVPL